MTDLNTRLIAAHDAGDKSKLIALYTEAANSSNDLNTKCFHLTHAYIFALDTGSPQTATLHARLVSHGREK